VLGSSDTGVRRGCASRGTISVKMIAEYLEHALQFERMAQEETDLALRESLLSQAKAYRKLASERAERQNLPRPPDPTAS
jgi:hypothetical protein